MIYYQIWDENTFEYKYLNKIKKNIIENPNIKCYIGFDFGFFRGINIYYGSNSTSNASKKIYENLINENINVRLYTNIDYDFDVIVLLGYTNLKAEKKYLKRKQKKIMKALSFF